MRLKARAGGSQDGDLNWGAGLSMRSAARLQRFRFAAFHLAAFHLKDGGDVGCGADDARLG